MSDLLLYLIQFAFIIVFILLTYVAYKLINSTKVPKIARFKGEETFACSDGSRKKFPWNTKDSSIYLSVVVPSYNEVRTKTVLIFLTIDVVSK